MWRTVTCGATVAFLALAACGGGGREATSSPSPSASPAEPTNIEAAGAKRLTIHGDWLAAGARGIWLSGDAEVYRLAPATGRKVATIPVPQVPCEAGDVGFGSLWSATCGEPGLVRIDPETDKVVGHLALKIPSGMGGEGSVGAGEGGVWLVVDGADCTSCRVARVDPGTMRVTAEVEVESGSAGVRTGAGAVWVTNPVEDIVEKIDPVAEKVVDSIGTGPGPRFFDVDEGGVWTLNQGDGTVTRIDPATGKATTVDASVPGDGGDLTAGGGWVWARGSGTLLTRIDAESGEVVERYGPSSGSGAVIVGGGAVWLSAHDINVVWRLPLP